MRKLINKSANILNIARCWPAIGSRPCLSHSRDPLQISVSGSAGKLGSWVGAWGCREHREYMFHYTPYFSISTHVCMNFELGKPELVSQWGIIDGGDFDSMQQRVARSTHSSQYSTRPWKKISEGTHGL